MQEQKLTKIIVFRFCPADNTAKQGIWRQRTHHARGTDRYIRVHCSQTGTQEYTVHTQIGTQECSVHR